MAQLTNYKLADSQTDIEKFEGDEFCVVIKWDGESKTIETFQRGYKDSLYVGEGMEAARESTGLSQEDWDSLLSVDVQYMEEVKGQFQRARELVFAYLPGMSDLEQFKVSYDHSSCSYGLPVLVLNGVAYGPADVSPLHISKNHTHAAKLVASGYTIAEQN